jgi:carbonic anhydrase
VKKVVAELERSTPFLALKAKEGSIQIIGVYYSLQSCKVSLLTEPHASASSATK